MDFIKVYDNVLSEEQCSHYIRLIDNGHQHPGRVADPDPKHQVKLNVKNSMDVCISEDYPEEVGPLIDIVNKLIERYQHDLGLWIPMDRCELFNGRFYPEGEGFYKAHIDAGNAMTMNRTVTILIYLNKVEGGEIEFPVQHSHSFNSN